MGWESPLRSILEDDFLVVFPLSGVCLDASQSVVAEGLVLKAARVPWFSYANRTHMLHVPDNLCLQVKSSTIKD